MLKLLQNLNVHDSWKLKIRSDMDIYIQAPGRINLIGEHTDYNLGFVMPAAIDKYIYFGFKANGTSQVSMKALNFNEYYKCELKNVKPCDKLWVNYLLGVVDQFIKRDLPITGFDVEVYGTIPIGSGLSSSAAIECGMARGIAELFDLELDKWDMVNIGNRTEHEFLGVKSGILDQFASVFGKSDHAMMMDCRSREFEYVPLHLGDYGFVVINSMVKHTHTTSGYLDRVRECGRAVDYFNRKFGKIESLRDIDEAMMRGAVNELDHIAYKRANFILNENHRVVEFKEAFKASDFEKAGFLLNTCHTGLSKEYEVSCKELDILADIARDHTACKGSRMMGGGFGGCTLNLVMHSQQDSFIHDLVKKYHSESGIVPDVYLLNVVNGVSVIEY